MVRVMGGEVEGPKATGSVGVKVAVRMWVPAGRDVVVRTAMPPGLTGCGSPSGVVPSVNWIMPGAPWAAPWGLTWAARTTAVPRTAGALAPVVEGHPQSTAPFESTPPSAQWSVAQSRVVRFPLHDTFGNGVRTA